MITYCDITDLVRSSARERYSHYRNRHQRAWSPRKPDELAAHQALMQGTESWQFMDGDTIVTVNPRGRFKADNVVAITAAALTGLGVAWLPDGIIDEYVASGALVPVMARYPPPSAGINVIRPPGQHPTRKVWVLTEMLIDCFEQAPHTVSTHSHVLSQATNKAIVLWLRPSDVIEQPRQRRSCRFAPPITKKHHSYI